MTLRQTDRALLLAQDGRCFYCPVVFVGGPPAHGEKPWSDAQWTRDHVRPRASGHAKAFNFVLCCIRCNRRKGCRVPTEDELARLALLYERATKIGKEQFGANFCWQPPPRAGRIFSTGPEKPSTPMAVALRPLAQK